MLPCGGKFRPLVGRLSRSCGTGRPRRSRRCRSSPPSSPQRCRPRPTSRSVPGTSPSKPGHQPGRSSRCCRCTAGAIEAGTMSARQSAFGVGRSCRAAAPPRSGPETPACWCSPRSPEQSSPKRPPARSPDGCCRSPAAERGNAERRVPGVEVVVVRDQDAERTQRDGVQAQRACVRVLANVAWLTNADAVGRSSYAPLPKNDQRCCGVEAAPRCCSVPAGRWRGSSARGSSTYAL